MLVCMLSMVIPAFGMSTPLTLFWIGTDPAVPMLADVEVYLEVERCWLAPVSGFVAGICSFVGSSLVGVGPRDGLVLLLDYSSGPCLKFWVQVLVSVVFYIL